MNKFHKKRWSTSLYVRIPRHEIGYFKFILESYENLCYMTVIDRFEAIVKISFLEESWDEMSFFLSALHEDMGLELIYISNDFQEKGYVSKQDSGVPRE